jgi:DNA-binding transcriptional MerR regulator
MCIHKGGVFLKIGDFAKLTNLPIKTIRYYSEIGLLTPKAVDKWTNYREYDFDQLIEISRILALKEAGLTLTEIKKLLQNHISKSDFLSLLETKLEEAKQEQLITTQRIANLQARIKHINLEEDYKAMVEINVKNIESIWVASIREKDVPINEFSGNFGIVSDDVKAHGIKEVGPWMFITHEDLNNIKYSEEGRGDWEACAQIEKGYISDNSKIKVYQLPAVDNVACFIHNGPWGAAMKSTFDDFFEWCRLNGMEWKFPNRQIFHVGERENSDWNTFVTEMQYPLK